MTRLFHLICIYFAAEFVLLCTRNEERRDEKLKRLDRRYQRVTWK